MAPDLPYLRRLANGALDMDCHVQPQASRTGIAGLHDGRLKIRLKAPPVDGKANRELCRFLADLADVSPSAVHVIRGETERRKTVRIDRVNDTNRLVLALQTALKEVEDGAP